MYRSLRHARTLPLTAGSITLTLALALAAAPAARAAVYSPTKTADSADSACNGDCSLREAITAANENPGADVILLPAGIYTLALAGAGEDLNATGDLDIRGELTIVGDGAGSTVIDAAGLDRVVHVTTLAPAAELRDLTLRNGSTPLSGGGLYAESEARLTRVVVSGNTAGGFGGGLSSGEALTVAESTISGNRSTRAGGGLIAAGSLTLTNSTVSGNRTTTEFGGGLYIFGGTAARVSNVTISGNTAALRGGGAFVESSAFIGENPPLFSNSVLAGNIAPEHPDCSGAAISAGYNLIGVGDGCGDFRPAQNDLEGTGAAPLDARLGPLGGNGGPTPTHPLLTGSPALNAGNPATPNGLGPACEAEDQRGLDRPGTGGGPARCDIGAFEVTAACVPGSTALCLNQSRFRVTATWRTPQGQSGEAQAVQLTPDAGYLWFFDPANIEITIKVIDGCALNDRYWVFASGLTNVRVDLRVEDTATGTVKTYLNPQGTTFAPRLDTAAFATCTYTEP
jgi:CSLREA domain-containing protein